jgi:hypothetical protein
MVYRLPLKNVDFPWQKKTYGSQFMMHIEKHDGFP